MYKSVEVVRLIAAILVVFCHYPLIIDNQFFNIFIGNNVFSGAIGVDLFFIISGFVIYRTVEKNENILHFWRDRVLRVFPLYVLVTVCYIVIAQKGITNDFIKSLFLVPILHDGIYIDPLVKLGWTLRYEMLFYFIVSLSIIVGSRLYTPIIIVIFLVVLGPFYKNYYSNPIIIEFLFGYLFSWFINRYTICSFVKYRWGLLLFSLIIFLLASLGKDNSLNYLNIPRMIIDYDYFSLNRVIAWGIPSFLLFFSVILFEDKTSWYGWKLGKYTYSVYLWQIFPLAYLSKNKQLFESYNSYIILISTFFFIVIISYLSYQYYEKPINSLKNKKIIES
ncbi:TPA: acyltransferase family protein [Photobacterium damselae]